jgi:hypothetical protein
VRRNEGKEHKKGMNEIRQRKERIKGKVRNEIE